MGDTALQTNNDLTQAADGHGPLGVCPLALSVLGNQGQDLAESLLEVRTKDGSHSTEDIGGVGNEGGLVLGRVGLRGSLVVSIGVLLTERLLLKDLNGESGNLVEVYETSVNAFESYRTANLQPSMTAGPHLFIVSASSEHMKMTTDLTQIVSLDSYAKQFKFERRKWIR